MSETVLTENMAMRLIINRRGEPLGVRAFDGEILTVGRDPASTVRLDDPAVAPEQAIILSEDGQLLFINRAEGTRLNGEALPREARRPLAPGDTLEIGPYTLLLAPAEEARANYEAQMPPPEVTRQNPLPKTSNPASDTRPTPEAPAAPPAKSFAAILDSLRTEEDSFYFQVETAGARQRVAVEGAEMVVGWDETGRRISFESVRVVAPRAVVRKDWSGVVVLPLSAGMISVNGEPAEAPRRLRDGDRLTLVPTAVAADPEENFLVFHEPASLVVLDTLLPQPAAPQPLPTETPQALVAAGAAQPSAPVVKRVGLVAPGRSYFGYFTLAEVLIMVFGTLVAAGIIFLILEYS